MSILTVLQGVSMTVGLTRPLSVFTNPARQWMEMQTIVNEAAQVIAKAYDWQRLRRLAVMPGTGSAEAFDLPADYDRMLKVAGLWSSRYRWDMAHVVSTDDWLALDVIGTPPVGGIWTLYGNQIHIHPAMGDAESVKFFYVTNQIVAGGKTAFTADTDTFVLSERLLKLCTVYLWKQSKGQDFVGELSDYEIALLQETNTDAGSKPVISGNARPRSSNVWPGTVVNS